MNKTRKHLAVFMPSLAGGGAERVTLSLVRGLIEDGESVDLILANKDGPLVNEIPSDANLIDLDVNRTIYALPKLVAYLIRTKPKALLSILDHANVIAILAKYISNSKTRVVVAIHSTPSHKKLLDDFKVRVTLFLAAFVYRRANAIVCVSQGAAEDSIKQLHLPKNKVHVIYNPVVLPEFSDRAKAPCDHIWLRNNRYATIVSAGRLIESKNFAMLITALKLVREEIDARLIIIGDGPELEKLKSLTNDLDLQDYVSFTGYVKDPIPYFSRASVFALSSNYEGLPTVLIEALALGTPCISTDCENGPREILDGGRWGQLSPVGDPRSMAQGLISILSGQYPRIHEEAWTPYTLRHITKLYRNLLNSYV